MDEEGLDTIMVQRTDNSRRMISEALRFTPDRTIVIRINSGKGLQLLIIFGGIGVIVGGVLLRGITGVGFGAIDGFIIGGFCGYIGYKIIDRSNKKRMKEYFKLSPEDILKADKYNYVIPNSDITEVELKRNFRGAKLSIQRNKQNAKIEWIGIAWKDVERKYENMLRPIFKDRLIVKR